MNFQASSPAHWSKDFVEHLRTVHLTLIATAAALVIVAATTKPYSTAVAKNEIHKIQELQTSWSAKLTYPMKHEMFSREEPRDVERIPISSGSSVEVMYATDGGSNRPKSITVYLPSELVVASMLDDSGKEVISGKFEELMPTIPNSLISFQKWWDSLDEHHVVVYFPTSVFAQAEVIENRHDFANQRLYTNAKIYSRGEWAVLLMSNIGNGSFRFPRNMGQVTVKLRGPKYEETDPDFVYDGSRSVEFVVSSFSYVRLNREALCAYLHLPPGMSDNTFYDLRQIANVNGVENLDKLEEILSKSEASESASFEAFGIKVPADLATVAGISVMLGIQLYFYVYLRRFHGSLRADDPGWDVPWIGMDSSKLAAGLFFATVLIVPASALVVLSAAAGVRITHGYWRVGDARLHLVPLSTFHWTVDLKIALMTLGVLLSMYLGVLCWRYRPQVAALRAEGEPLRKTGEATSLNAEETGTATKETQASTRQERRRE